MIKKTIVMCTIAFLMGAGFALAAEFDDATLFMDAFNAYQKQDYLLAIEKAAHLNQAFPESPLRDVTLLLVARSAIKSGNNELAAKTISKFRDEYPGSALTGTIEEDLMSLSSRILKGEQLQPNKQLQAAARKVRDDRLALERAAALKLEQEKLAREKAERERIALEKAESERRERERIAAEKAEKESIKAAISVQEGGTVVAVGQNGTVPVEISNRSKNIQEFLLDVSAADDYRAFMAAAGKSEQVVKRITLVSGESFKGEIHFKMPNDKVDGHRAALTIRTVSSKYSDVVQTKEALVIASAPLVRVVAKLVKAKVAPGEQLRYKVSLLNIGSQSAHDLTVRIQLPPELDLVAAPELKFRKEQNGALVFDVDRIETGKLVEIGLHVKVKKSSRNGQELRGRIEVVNGQLQRTDFFIASASVVESNP